MPIIVGGIIVKPRRHVYAFLLFLVSIFRFVFLLCFFIHPIFVPEGRCLVCLVVKPTLYELTEIGMWSLTLVGRKDCPLRVDEFGNPETSIVKALPPCTEVRNVLSVINLCDGDMGDTVFDKQCSVGCEIQTSIGQRYAVGRAFVSLYAWPDQRERCQTICEAEALQKSNQSKNISCLWRLCNVSFVIVTHEVTTREQQLFPAAEYPVINQTAQNVFAK
jgi:hypothetical protein